LVLGSSAVDAAGTVCPEQGLYCYRSSLSSGVAIIARKPQLLVTVFSDYICPFCYVGHRRLAKLRDRYDLKIYWRFIEIHPETPAEGQSVDELGYVPEQWQAMMSNLRKMSVEDGIDIGDHRLTANSHKALLLAEAAKEQGADIFYRLNDRLYEAFFGEGANIGDTSVLRSLADECGVTPETVERAWSDPEYESTLNSNLQAAVDSGVTGTPTFFIGEERISGAVPFERLLQAAENAILKE
jgi:predicted DsbA family dithiol-disulfide isomerase